MGVFDNETMTFINQTYQRADAFLFDGGLHELFAGYWGAERLAPRRKIRASTRSQSLNTRPKYLVSNTLTEPRGEHDRPLRRRRGGHRRAESEAGGELQVQRSGALIRWLLDSDLVDEMNLLIVPVKSSARARGCSPTPAWTLRLTWSTRGPTRRV